MSYSDRFDPELDPLVKEESTTSESRDSSDEKQWWVGEKLLVLSKEIGKSGKGTVVYQGVYNDEEVAVKRVLKSHLVDYNEIDILKNFVSHQNIVSYKGDESDRYFRYLILELCLCNLYDLIQICPAPNQLNPQKKDLCCSMSSVTLIKEDRLEKLKVILGGFKIYNEITGRPSPLLLKLMRQMVSGLVSLHQLGIIHRDLKPENILITKEGPTLRVKLSDMDISRCLAEDKSSLSNHHTGSGTMGWTAPEKLHDGRQTCKMDMFSLGCVLFFCFTGGKHPYGDHDERNGNIKKDIKQNMYMLQDFPEAFHLISSLLESDLEKRPTAIDVLNNPIFGDADKKTSEDGGDHERKTLKGASSLAKASGSAKVSQQLDFVESGKSSICRGSTSSDTNDESTCSGSGMMGDKQNMPTAIDVLNNPMFGDADKKTSEDGGDHERKTLKGASSLAKASGSAKVSQQLDFFESGKSSICRGSTSSDTNDESTCSGSGMMGYKQNMYIIQNFPEAFHLISALLEADPKKRPKLIEVCNHPLFWDAEKRLSFLNDTCSKIVVEHLLHEGFDDYFTGRFPTLLIEVYKVVCKYGKEVDYFRKYFKANM